MASAHNRISLAAGQPLRSGALTERWRKEVEHFDDVLSSMRTLNKSYIFPLNDNYLSFLTLLFVRVYGHADANEQSIGRDLETIGLVMPENYQTFLSRLAANKTLASTFKYKGAFDTLNDHYVQRKIPPIWVLENALDSVMPNMEGLCEESSPTTVLNFIEKSTGVPVDVISGSDTHSYVSKARSMFCFVAHGVLPKASYAGIGRELNGRTGATINTLVQNFLSFAAQRKDVGRAVDEIMLDVVDGRNPHGYQARQMRWIYDAYVAHSPCPE